MNQYQEVVHRGAELLDSLRPGWHEEIRTDALSMMSGCRCIIGQLTGDFNRGIKELNIEHPKMFGLNITEQGDLCSALDQWDDLDVAWKEAIHDRS